MSFVERVKAWWLGLEKSQRPIWLMGGALLAILVIGAVVLAGRPQMSLLFGGLNPADQGMVVEELSKIGIKAEADTSGNVFVTSTQVATARMKLAVAKKLPNSGSIGSATLDSIGAMTPPSVEKEKLKTSQESDLATSIETISGVGSARVHLTLGEDSPFQREVKPASASVVIGEVNGSGLNDDQAQSIARLVQFAVEGLKVENITIINDQGKMLFDGAANGSVAGSADKRISMEIDEARRRERDLQSKLDGAFGVGNTIVSIPILRLNYDQISEQNISHDPSKRPSAKEMVKESMGDSSSDPSGAAGTQTNTQPPVETDNASSRNYEGTHSRETYEINESRKNIERAPGTLEAMSINVLVNSESVKDAVPIQTFVSSYLAPYSTDSANFTSNVVSTPFDTTAAKKMKDAAAGAAMQDKLQQFLSMAPILVLVFVGVMIMKSLGKTAKVLVPDPLPTANDPSMKSLGEAGAFPIPEALASLPELRSVSKEDLAHLAELPVDQLSSAISALASAEPAHAIELIPDKVNVPLEQIKQMARLKPEAVSNLLRTWLLEEKR